MQAHPLEDGASYEGGLANLVGYWRGEYNYTPDKFVTLSGGDSWTGPYISTVLKGAPVVDIMNAAGYDAQVIGNHDFDFGVGVLEQRARQARFPLLAANIYRIGVHTRPPYAVGSTTVSVGGARVGVIGLANIDTPVVTHPRNVAGLAFSTYDGSLRRENAALRAQTVDTVVAIFHQEVEDLLPLAPLFRELGIPFVGSGHSHQPSLSIDRGDSEGPEDDIIFCNPGPYARSFCLVKLTYTDWPPRLSKHHAEIVRVHGKTNAPKHPPAADIQKIVTKAKETASSAGNELLARTQKGLYRKDPDQRLGHLVVDAWLDAFPQAQIAITNAGGLRQDMDPGDITMATLVGVLPFDNYLVIVDITGAELKKVLAHPQTIAGGVRFTYRCAADNQRQILSAADNKGNSIVDDKIYKIVVNEFIYRGGDRYLFREFDPTPEETAVHWREPVARYLRDLTAREETADLAIDGRSKAEGKACSSRY